MYEISHFINTKKNFTTVIIDLQNGRFKLAGSIPVELTREVKSGFTTTLDSIIFQSEQATIDALLAIGITKFQLSDCSWYQVSNA